MFNLGIICENYHRENDRRETFVVGYLLQCYLIIIVYFLCFHPQKANIVTAMIVACVNEEMLQNVWLMRLLRSLIDLVYGWLCVNPPSYNCRV